MTLVEKGLKHIESCKSISIAEENICCGLRILVVENECRKNPRITNVHQPDPFQRHELNDSSFFAIIIRPATKIGTKPAMICVRGIPRKRGIAQVASMIGLLMNNKTTPVTGCTASISRVAMARKTVSAVSMVSSDVPMNGLL